MSVQALVPIPDPLCIKVKVLYLISSKSNNSSIDPDNINIEDDSVLPTTIAANSQELPIPVNHKEPILKPLPTGAQFCPNLKPPLEKNSLL